MTVVINSSSEIANRQAILCLMSYQCPCCTNSLLRHLNQKQLYWFCPHCKQTMPTLESKLKNINKQKLFRCL